MAEVIVRTKIYAKNPKDIEKIGKELAKIAKVGESKTEELAFGIKILRIVFIVNESEGLETLEEKIKKIKGVSQIEIDSVDRAL